MNDDLGRSCALRTQDPFEVQLRGAWIDLEAVDIGVAQRHLDLDPLRGTYHGSQLHGRASLDQEEGSQDPRHGQEADKQDPHGNSRREHSAEHWTVALPPSDLVISRAPGRSASRRVAPTLSAGVGGHRRPDRPDPFPLGATGTASGLSRRSCLLAGAPSIHHAASRVVPGLEAE